MVYELAGDGDARGTAMRRVDEFGRKTLGLARLSKAMDGVEERCWSQFSDIYARS